MRTKLFSILFLISIVISIDGYGQDMSITDIVWSSRLENIGENGYYYFCSTEEDINSTKRQVRLRILDANFKQVSEPIIELEKLSYYGPKCSNGNSLVCSFIDPKSKTILVKSFNLKGELIGTKNFQDSKQTHPYMHKAYPLIEFTPFEKGYIIMTALRTGKLKQNCRLTCVDESLNVIWVKDLINDDYTIHVNAIESYNNNVFVSYMEQKLSANQFEESNQYIICIDKNGKEIFKYTIQGNTYFMPSELKSTENELIVSGAYSKDKNSEGIKVLKLTHQGELVSSNEYNWKDKFAANYPSTISMKENNNQNPKFIIHDIIFNPNNSLQIIAELIFSESSNTYTGGGKTSSGVKFELGDLIVLNINEDLSLKNFHVIEKNPSSIILGGLDNFESNQSYMQKYILSNAYTYYRSYFANNGNTQIVYQNIIPDKDNSGSTINMVTIDENSTTLATPNFTKAYYNKNRDQIYTSFIRSQNEIIIHLAHVSEDKKSYTLSISKLLVE